MTSAALVCPVCATPTVPGARFCFSCGAQLAGGAAGTDVETERRVVTVLFGDLSDFTSWAEDLDPERVGVVIDRVLASLVAIVTEFGGHVDKLVGDGLMAVFGAPTAHEDDAERAVRAAARMQSVVRRLVAQESGGGRQLGLRVGLNTGEVAAGVQANLAYTVVGDTVNTASRPRWRVPSSPTISPKAFGTSGTPRTPTPRPPTAWPPIARSSTKRSHAPTRTGPAFSTRWAR
ncbi:MAG: adenylate/guanylate cyclase domain-containing protein [Mycobacteriales bacterium]